MTEQLAWGVCIGQSGKFSAVAKPAILRCDPGANVLTRANPASIAAAYNSMLEEAVDLGVENLVLLHDDLELVDPQAPTKFAAALQLPDVALVGVVGGRGIKDMPWWTADQRIGRAPDGFWEHLYDPAPGDVDALDGILLGFSYWAVRNLRFDCHYPAFHGYDADICRQARMAGKRILVEDIEVFHHTSTGRGSSASAWHVALQTWRLKWLGGPWYRRLIWRCKRFGYTLRR